MVSILSLIFISFRLLKKKTPSGTIQSVPATTGITVILMFHSFFQLSGQIPELLLF